MVFTTDKILKVALEVWPDILTLDEKISYSNLTKGERNTLYLLRDDPFIIIKEAGKGSAVVVWDREDYLREANSQLSQT